jgi:hypothetical protein
MQKNVLIAILAIVLLAAIDYFQCLEINNQRRQIDHLSQLVPSIMASEEEPMDFFSYYDIPEGRYILRFTNFREKWVIAERLSKADEQHYVRVMFVPENILDDWKPGEYRYAPDLLQ